MKKTKCILIAAVLCLSVLSAALFGACGKKDGYPVWDISAGEEKVYASFSDNGNYGYILTVEGSGKIKSFSSADKAPWYKKSGRVTEIVIPDGITEIGDNAFPYCHYVKTVILPESVTAIGGRAFSAKTAVCAKSDVTVADGARVYAYSETKPEESGYFWHLKTDGAIDFWETQKILFIGNSFTYYNDMPAIFAAVAASAGVNVVAESITEGAYTLSKFADPADAFGAKVNDALNAHDDYGKIVLQEQSARPLENYSLFLDGAKSLNDRIYKTQESCEVYLYATWGYPDYTADVSAMGANLRAAYVSVANELGVKVSHVGTAFDTVNAEHTEINLYNADNRHPSPEGSYLAACVHAATLLNIDVRTVTYAPDGIGADVAATLREVAYATATGA